jgi:glycolate oxidase FAD binding subunit
MNDHAQTIQQQIAEAYHESRPLAIVGGNSKAFYGNTVNAEKLDVTQHTGIVNYAASELVITARCGTPLREINNTLAEHKQMLAFEPPQFGDSATIGGTVACNLSGPRRAYAGAARDFVLGCKIINGKGELLSFGGEVMKNVAGYDVSRLMAGALGTLGVISEVSLKVLPLPETEITLVLECSDAKALESMHRWSRAPLPISASCYDGDRLFIRIGASAAAVAAARKHIGGELYAAGEAHWQKIREHQHAFFQSKPSLWRLSVESSAAPMKLEGKFLYEWGGALRWCETDASADVVRTYAATANGHATLFRGKGSSRFHPLDEGLLRVHQKLKYAFDPQHILNPGRMYADI